MKTRAALAVVVLVAFTVWLGAEEPQRTVSTYSDALYGFTIQAPRFPNGPAGSHVVPVVLRAPTEGAFSANVNVMVQHVAMTRLAYREATLTGFNQMGWKAISESDLTVSGRDAMLIEYEGSMGGQAFRWLALAVLDKERVFLVTCTATKDTFAKYEKEFRTCLDSFRL